MSMPQPIIQLLRSGNWAVLFLLLFTGVAMPVAAQDYTVKTWGVDDGLPESSITDAVQSRDGYLWISTLNSDLSRFDGVRFVNFSLPFASQFTGGGARRLFAGQDGTLWINGFGNYLASLRAGTFQLEKSQPVVINYLVADKAGQIVFVTKEGELLEGTGTSSSNTLWKIIPAPGAGANTRFFPDAENDFWYRNTNGAVCRLKNGSMELMPMPPGKGGVLAVAGDNAGRIAVGNASGLFLLTDEGFQDLTPTNGKPDVVIKGLVSDGQGGWWVDANNHLRRCRNRQWIAEAVDWRQQNRTWSRVRWEQPDLSGGVWMAYADGGVVHVSGSGKLSALTTSDGLPSNRVRMFSQDREGNVWASFERGGLVRIRPRLFQAVGSRDGLADSVTTSVCEDRQGAIWIGTLSGVVSRWYQGVCDNFTLPLEGTHCDMSTVFPDSSGRVWIGTHGNGLLVYEAGQFHHVLSIEQVGVNIRGIFISRDGRVWIASQDGLFCLADGKVRQVLQPKFEADYPTALTEGADGTIWVAMNTGVLLKIINDRTQVFQPADSIMHCRFSAICEDAQGTIWIGTFGAGLLRFQDGKFTTFTKQDGLPSDNISQVLDDGTDKLWLGSPAGVFSVQKKLLDSRNETSACRIFGLDDGLPTVGCATASQPTVWRGRDGRIWFATANGVTSIQPQDSETAPKPPLVLLENVSVDGQPEDLSATEKTGLLKLSPGRHQLEFRFTGLSFASPERIRFKYMLEGLDPAWVENRTERTASYNIVPPGKYRFRVLACNGDGVWSDTESSLALILPQHLWETRWFHLAELALILGLVTGSVYWTLQTRYRRQLRVLEQQQALERERTRIAQDIHDDLGASLTRITMLSQSALNKAEAVKFSNHEVTRIYATARAMTNAMDEIVWAINPRHDSIESVAAYFADFVEEFLSPTGLRFRIDFPLTVPPWTINAEVRHNLFLAFKEALNNVVKHSKAGEVIVTLEIGPKSYALTVKDNGCGFETTLPAGNRSNHLVHGNGLANMRRRLEELGGRCTIDSVPGKGTRVCFEMELRT
jgi:signal transduction histidine kinase/ligand-binding sensor domain-containing protein